MIDNKGNESYIDFVAEGNKIRENNNIKSLDTVQSVLDKAKILTSTYTEEDAVNNTEEINRFLSDNLKPDDFNTPEFRDVKDKLKQLEEINLEINVLKTRMKNAEQIGMKSTSEKMEINAKQTYIDSAKGIEELEQKKNILQQAIGTDVTNKYVDLNNKLRQGSSTITNTQQKQQENSNRQSKGFNFNPTNEQITDILQQKSIYDNPNTFSDLIDIISPYHTYTPTESYQAADLLNAGGELALEDALYERLSNHPSEYVRHHFTTERPDKIPTAVREALSNPDIMTGIQMGVQEGIFRNNDDVVNFIFDELFRDENDEGSFLGIPFRNIFRFNEDASDQVRSQGTAKGFQDIADGKFDTNDAKRVFNKFKISDPKKMKAFQNTILMGRGNTK